MYEEEENHIDYQGFIDQAMRGVVRQALEYARDEGLPGNHHFFISFDTNFSGASISPALKERYPEEMTIVLQYQFWDLEIFEEYFSVMLSFNNVPEKLVIPFNALTAFADPSIKFGLQFHNRPAFSDMVQDNGLSTGKEETSFDNSLYVADNGDGEQSTGTAEVFSLDAFRNK